MMVCKRLFALAIGQIINKKIGAGSIQYYSRTNLEAHKNGNFAN